MQNGRNRIAAHGRVKSGPAVPAARRPARRQGKSAGKLEKIAKAATPAFPADVAVALPPGVRVPAAFPAGAPKKPRRPKAKAAGNRKRPPGRKKRAAAREAAIQRHTALVPVPAPRRTAASPRHPATPDVICLASLPAPAEAAAALPLPPTPEPLVVAAQITQPLPRSRALARPARGLVAAISDWIRSAHRLVLAGLLPRKPRRALPRSPRTLPASMARRQKEKVDA